MAFRSIARAAALALVATSIPAAAEWREASSEHFIVYADSGEDWLRNFATRLERFDATLRLTRGIAAQEGERANRLVVYVLPSVEAVQKLHGGSSVAGFYIPRVSGSVAYTARNFDQSVTALTSDAILFHEYSHHFMLANAAAPYPRWMVEGFAEFNGTARMRSDGGVELGHAANYRAHGLLLGPSLPIAQVLDPPIRMDDARTDVFYGRAWLLTHLLTFDQARTGQMGKYLTLINKGRPNLDAAKEAFGDLRVLDKQLDTYMKRPLSGLRIPASRLSIGKVEVRDLSAGEAAMMPVRLRSDRGVDRAAAAPIVADARRRAAAFPTDAAAQAVLAEAEYDAGNDAEAEAAADRALAADLKHLQALIYKGRVRVRRLEAGGHASEAQWKEARSWFIKAAAAVPDAAEPLALFYRSFLSQGVRPTDNAQAALLKAFELAPHDPGVRMQAVYVMLNNGEGGAARRALLPLAFDPHRRGESNFAGRLVELLDQGMSPQKVAQERPAG